MDFLCYIVVSCLIFFLSQFLTSLTKCCTLSPFFPHNLHWGCHCRRRDSESAEIKKVLNALENDTKANFQENICGKYNFSVKVGSQCPLPLLGRRGGGLALVLSMWCFIYIVCSNGLFLCSTLQWFCCNLKITFG